MRRQNFDNIEDAEQKIEDLTDEVSELERRIRELEQELEDERSAHNELISDIRRLVM